MTSLWNRIASRLGFGTDRSERFVTLGRLAILWERLWRASWPASGIAGLFLAAALFGVFEIAPHAVHLAALFLAVLAVGAFLHRNLKGFAVPRWDDGARRVERDSGLVHRPISEGRDRLAAGAGDSWTESLWRAHLRAQLARVANLKVNWPRPGLQRGDPYAMRFAVLLLVLAGLGIAGGEWSKRLAAGLTPESSVGASTAQLDAWINPPAYTGEAPLYLQHPLDDSVAVPSGSELELRVHAARGLPNLAVSPEDRRLKFAGGSGEYAAEFPLAHDGTVRVLADGRVLTRFAVKAISDAPPVIAFASPPSKTEHDALKIAFTAGDDYGVVSARAIIRPAVKNAHAVLSVDLPLAAASAKTLSQSVYRDLTGEPLAGVEVNIVLEAKDGAGQTGYSKPARVRLPARVFTNALARALIEQRQNLAIGAPKAKENAELVLDALTLAPEHFYDKQPNIYLAVRSAYWGLKNARNANDVAQVEQLLWDTAAALEQGGLLVAADQLRQLQQLLTQALQQGAPQDVIEALLERYRDALQRYLQALAQQAPQQNGALSSNAKTITPQDLDALLKAIEQMSQTGSREAAARALAMLQNLLENLHMAQGGGAGGTGDKALGDAIRQLGDLIGRQRNLMDKTYRQGQGAGDPKDGGGKGLAGKQAELHDDLDKVMKGLGAKKLPRTLPEAGRQMQSAQGQLGENDFDDAGQAEKKALAAMQDTADALAKALMEENGQSGPQGDANDQDPLGRQEGANGLATGNGVKIPDHDVLARARSILEELRRRAAERGRPKEELDYYDRLLKEF